MHAREVEQYQATLKEQFRTEHVRNVVVHLTTEVKATRKVLLPAYVLDYTFGKKQGVEVRRPKLG